MMSPPPVKGGAPRCHGACLRIRQQCPSARGIIHLGATSCYVGDNTDLIIQYEALRLILKKLVNAVALLSRFADQYKSLPTLAFTHFQPAHPTTLGKRASLLFQEYLMDIDEVEYRIKGAKLLGSKGTTGTQASFLELFEGDHEKCRALDRMIAKKMGFKDCFAVSGQTYPRKMDAMLISTLSGIAQSAAKFSNDIRLLQHMKEIEEPFEKPDRFLRHGVQAQPHEERKDCRPRPLCNRRCPQPRHDGFNPVA